MSFYKVAVSFWKDKQSQTQKELFFSINSQDAFFQLKYWHMMGYDMISPTLMQYFSNGDSITKLNISDLENMSTWARSIMSYKKQLANIEVVKDRIQ